MSWKKALFLGGAVLLLAACSDATAPSSLVQRKTGSANLVAGAPTNASVTLDGADAPLVDDISCRSGYYVRSGDKDICIELPEIP